MSDGDWYFPLIGEKWLAGTAHLSPSARGILIGLLILMHEAGGPVPYHEAKICKRLGIRDRRTLVKALDELIENGEIRRGPDGTLSNDRAMDDIAKRHAKRQRGAKGPKGR
jgi:uncharacterized protein YdaU (DUF1376 family)